MVFNGRLDSVVRHNINFPANAIPEAGTVFVRLYPGPLSQVVEGMDTLLRMPYGCFEQTSSSTYPNVLALDYMKRTKKAAPEVSAKAEGYIASGYQRLLTFEVPGGGFSWFGNAPANKILTSYGLMEFSDMSKVHDVDARVIQRTQQWLASQQQPDGSWRPDASVHQRRRHQSLQLRRAAHHRIYCLVARSHRLPGAGGRERLAVHRIAPQRRNAKPDVYTLAVLANFAADYAKAPAFTGQVMQLLLDARTEQNDQVWWSAAETEHVRHRHERRGRDHRPRGAGFVEERQQFRRRIESDELHRFEEGRRRRMGLHAGHHHGVARPASLDGKRRRNREGRRRSAC